MSFRTENIPPPPKKKKKISTLQSVGQNFPTKTLSKKEASCVRMSDAHPTTACVERSDTS